MKCPHCSKFMKETEIGFSCVCGHNESLIEFGHSLKPQSKTVAQEIHDNYWYGTVPETEEAKAYCDYWHDGEDEE